MGEEGLIICQKCKNGGLYFNGHINSIGPRLFFLYKCESCERTKWLDLKPSNVAINDELLRRLNEN